MRSLLAKVAFFGLMISTVTAQAELASPTFYYTKPKSALGVYLSDTKIVKSLEAVIDASVSGSQIHMSLYNFADMPDDRIQKAVERAVDRGVDVWIVMDDSANETFHTGARDKFQRLLGSHVRICKREGCLDPKGNNHNKFYLFSKIKFDGKVYENVVVQMSANIGFIQSAKFNDMVVLHSEKPIYDGYMQYWAALFAEKTNNDYMNGPGGIVESGAFKAYFTPSVSGDPVLEALTKANCSGGGSIRLAQSSFEQKRALDVIKQLKRLKNSGCNVMVAVRKEGEDNEHIDPLRLSKLEVYVFSVVLHAKFTAIDATIDGVRKQMVFTGSANMKDSSIRKNDETILKIKGKGAFDSYNAFFNKIKEAGKRLR